MIRYKDCDKYLLSFLNNVNARTNNAYKDTKTFYEHVLSVTTGIVLEAMEDMAAYYRRKRNPAYGKPRQKHLYF